MPGAGEVVETEGLFHLAGVAEDGADAGVRRTSGAHIDEVAGNVGGVDAVFFDKAEGVLEIGSGADGGFEGAVLFIATAAAIEGGVGRHPAGLEKPGGKRAAPPAAHDFALLVDELEVAVDGIAFRVGGEVGGDVGKDLIVVVVVVGVEEADDIARGESDSFVHGVVDAIVRL